jgi:hypothetical protein
MGMSCDGSSLHHWVVGIGNAALRASRRDAIGSILATSASGQAGSRFDSVGTGVLFLKHHTVPFGLDAILN